MQDSRCEREAEDSKALPKSKDGKGEGGGEEEVGGGAVLIE
jgi:hypothetical protein